LTSFWLKSPINPMTKTILDILAVTQPDVNLWYIERSPDISFVEFISDIKLIHGTYRNFTFTVKLRVRKIGLLENKKGESKR
jgi:hypothetical protein